jgi:hypothetical protein
MLPELFNKIIELNEDYCYDADDMNIVFVNELCHLMSQVAVYGHHDPLAYILKKTTLKRMFKDSTIFYFTIFCY